jgi:hypothetical protein
MSPHGKENVLAKAAKTPPSALKRRSVGGTPLSSGLRARAPLSPTQELRLPPEFDVPSDSPLLKKPRNSISSARKSRVSFGGVQMKTFYKVSPATTRESEGSEASEESVACEVSDDAVYNNSPRTQGRPSVTQSIPSLADVLAQDATATGPVIFDAGEETKAMPALRDLGNLDSRSSLDTTVSLDAEPSLTIGLNTETVDADISSLITSQLAKGSLELTTSLNTSQDPSLKALLTRTAMGSDDGDTGEVDGLGDDSMEMTACYGKINSAPGSGILVVTDPGSPAPQEETSEDREEFNLRGSIFRDSEKFVPPKVQQQCPAKTTDVEPTLTNMSLTNMSLANLHGLSHQKALIESQFGMSPAIAAASVTTFSAPPPESPNLKQLLASRNSPANQHGEHSPFPGMSSPAEAPSAEAGAIGMMIPAGRVRTEANTAKELNAAGVEEIKGRLSLTPKLESPVQCKSASLLAATASSVEVSRIASASGDVSTPPSLLRASSRLTMTASGTSPFKVQSTKDGAAVPGGRNTGDMIEDAEKTQGVAAVAAEEYTAELSMPMQIPEQPLASPSSKAVARQSRGGGGGGAAVLRHMIRRRSSMVPQSVVPQPGLLAMGTPMTALMQSASDSEKTDAVCQTFAQFLAMADVRFLDDLSTNRRQTLMVRQPCETAESLEECRMLLATALPELTSLQAGCDEMANAIHITKKKNSEAERAANANPPALFARIASSADAAAGTELRAQLATLKRICRNEAKVGWYEWYGNVGGGMQQEAAKETEVLVDEAKQVKDRIEQYQHKHQEMCAQMSSLGVASLGGMPLLRTEQDVVDPPHDSDPQKLFLGPKDILCIQNHMENLLGPRLSFWGPGSRAQVVEVVSLEAEAEEQRKVLAELAEIERPLREQYGGLNRGEKDTGFKGFT